MMAIIPKILLIDDDVEFNASVKNFLQAANYHVTSFINANEALMASREEFFDIVICDVYIPFYGMEVGGLEVAKIIIEKNPACFVIIISQYASASLFNKFLKAPSNRNLRYLEKTPIVERQLSEFNEPLLNLVREGLNSKFIFVCMPYDDKFNDVYELGIRGAVTELGFTCMKANEMQYNGGIIQKVYESINTAHLIIADMTDEDPNVFYEVGYAHAMGKDVILITQNADKIPTNLSNFVHTIYDSSKVRVLKENLKQKIQELLS
ncbi:MAG: response regulator [Nitrospirae bacterium]|nr:response regulator [Nitrospirota bacterium]